MLPELVSLQQLAQGLLVISESEAPLEAFQLPAGEHAEAGLRRLAGTPADAPVEIQEAALFFQKQEAMYAGSAEAARFRALGTYLASQAQELRLYRIGSIQIEAFLLGTLPDGTLGGLRTRLVET